MSYPKLARYLFALALPLFLITTSVRYVVSEPRLYEYGYEKYNVVAATGLDSKELQKAAQGIAAYFNSSEESIDIQVVKQGQVIALFNDREVAHMKDVKAIIRMLFRLQDITLVYMLGYLVVGLVALRRAFWTNLATVVTGGSIFAVMIVVMFSVASLLDFDNLLLQFHLFSFSNDLWLLNPATDYLIRMTPQGFLQDMALFIALGTLVGALVLGGLAIGYLILKAKQTPTIKAMGATQVPAGTIEE